MIRDDYMIIGVMTDLHLGYRQYGSIDREKDFYIQLQKCVKELNNQCCDIVIIAGDIFDKPNPSPEAIHQYEYCISNLNANTIIAIKGNHTMLLRDNHYSIDKFFDDSLMNGYHLLEDESWNNSDVWIDGITYRGNSKIDEFIEMQHLLANKKSEDQYRILVIHQAVSEFCGFVGEELSINDFDTSDYNLIICGHIHSRLIQTLSDGTIFLQPGSIERLNTTEARDESENQKGVWTIDTIAEEITFHFIEQERAFLMGEIEIHDDDDINTHIKNVKDKIEYLDVAPVLSYDYHDFIGNKSKINDMMIDLSKECLLSNCKIFDETVEEVQYDIEENGSFTINSIIQQNDTLSDDEKALFIDIHNAFNNDAETIEKLLEDYKEKHFNEEPTFDLAKEQEWIQEQAEFFENL